MSPVEGTTRLAATRVVVATIVAVAALVVGWALARAVPFLPAAPAGFWAMGLAALIVDLPLFGIARRGEFQVRSTLSVCYTFAIFTQWGAAPAILVQAVASTVSVAIQRYPRTAGLYTVARLICATAAAELVVNVTGLGPVTAQGAGLSGDDLAVFLVLATVWLAANYLLLQAAWANVTNWLRPPTSEARVDLATTATSVLVMSPLLTTVTSWWPVALAAPPLAWNRLARVQMMRERSMVREPVTGLLNRQGLAQGMRAITAADLNPPAGQRPFGIILLSFESVMDINRTLGRDIYERVVGVASRRLLAAYGEDRTARLLGDSLVILWPDLAEPDAIARTEAAVSVLGSVIEVDDIPFTLDPVGGAALSPVHGTDLGTLLMRAEFAAGEARRTGRRAALYVPHSAEQADRRTMLLRELHAVLRDESRRRELAVLYQPQVDVHTGHVRGVEALLRWTHPRWGAVPTAELIEATEPSEIMHLLTRHVLDHVATQLGRWNAGGERLRASVNVSVQDLHQPDFVAAVADLVRAHHIAPRQLVLEITERMLISDAGRVKKVADDLSRYGVGLSLDDFGTGYASLQQLRQLPLTEVKVDGSYVSAMVDSPADAAIVTSVYQLAGALGLDVVAEGVEDRRTAEAVGRLTGTIGQGWHFGRPMTVEQLEEWLRARSARSTR